MRSAHRRAMQDKEDDRGWFLQQQAACRKIRFQAYCSPLGFSVLKVSFEDRLVQLYVAGPYQSIQHCSESVSFSPNSSISDPPSLALYSPEPSLHPQALKRASKPPEPNSRYLGWVEGLDRLCPCAALRVSMWLCVLF